MLTTHLWAQNSSTQPYKKRVLETTEVDFLSSYYLQDGENAAVSGGEGSEELSDVTATFIVSIPMNDDAILTIDAGISAYSSASSSNIDPFDKKNANPFNASSGASQSDLWNNLNISYSHSSDDRNQVWSLKGSVASEYDYTSFGIGGSYTHLFNQKNSELSLSANIFFDNWTRIYPVELRPFSNGGPGLNAALFKQNTISGEENYNPQFNTLSKSQRNSYSFGVAASQILSKNLTASISLDVISQHGLLSTPFQRVYFKDKANSFIDNFQLADDIERLPDSRLKYAAGSRLNYYINELFIMRSSYRFYSDDWGIRSHTAQIEIPIKISQNFTLYPSYRFYNQTSADYFAKKDHHLSTSPYYTSDYDLSKYDAHQFGFGVRYSDHFSEFRLGNFGLKSLGLKYINYRRSNGLTSNMVSLGANFIIE